MERAETFKVNAIRWLVELELDCAGSLQLAGAMIWKELLYNALTYLANDNGAVIKDLFVALSHGAC